MVILKGIREMKAMRKFMGPLNHNPLFSFVPAIDSNMANATQYIKSTRTAGFFMQRLRSSVNKETNEMPGHCKCPTEKPG